MEMVVERDSSMIELNVASNASITTTSTNTMSSTAVTSNGVTTANDDNNQHNITDEQTYKASSSHGGGGIDGEAIPPYVLSSKVAAAANVVSVLPKARDTYYDNINLFKYVTIAQKDEFIRDQHEQTCRLRRELEGVIAERDLLLCEVSNLRFQLEMSELKSINDHSVDESRPRSQAPIWNSMYANDQTMQSYANGGQHAVEPIAILTRKKDDANVIYAKKGSLRNNTDVHKRNRNRKLVIYEQSQDFLDKQVEMLELKYGGMKARKAALTIQRAFRRHTLLKKFAAITAMAKLENRRRLPNVNEAIVESEREDTPNQMWPAPLNNTVHEQIACERNTTPTIKATRSMSLRENKPVDVIHFPRSQSGTSNPLLISHISYLNSIDICKCGFMNCDKNCDAYHQNSGSCSDMIAKIDAKMVSGVCDVDAATTASSSYTAGACCPYAKQPTKKVPPEVPKRTSSISMKSNHARMWKTNSTIAYFENGSLSSVQSSGSDSSNIEANNESVRVASPEVLPCDKHRQSDMECLSPEPHLSDKLTESELRLFKESELVRKRQYCVGVNLFNRMPERGIDYLTKADFVEKTPKSVAEFLINRKGLSKQMVGEYLGNLQREFNMEVLKLFVKEIDLTGLQVDDALRKFQAHFRMPGEAQKIERLMEAFSERYRECNSQVMARFRSPDTVFVLAFAIVMLNTDLHSPSLKQTQRMTLDSFIRNLRGIDDGHDIERDMLVAIYERIKANEFKPSADHVTKVMKVQSTIVGKKPNLALPHRRIISYCRLYEIPDVNKKERPGVHQRDVFLFNDLLVTTKLLSKKKDSPTYTYRQSYSMFGICVELFSTEHYAYGIRFSQRIDGKLLISFNARNDHDRHKFVQDVRESVREMDDLESERLETELARQNGNWTGNGQRNTTTHSSLSDIAMRIGAELARLHANRIAAASRANISRSQPLCDAASASTTVVTSCNPQCPQNQCSIGGGSGGGAAITQICRGQCVGAINQTCVGTQCVQTQCTSSACSTQCTTTSCNAQAPQRASINFYMTCQCPHDCDVSDDLQAKVQLQRAMFNNSEPRSSSSTSTTIHHDYDRSESSAKPQRSESVGSLDRGTYKSSSSTTSHTSSLPRMKHKKTMDKRDPSDDSERNQSFLSGLFGKRDKTRGHTTPQTDVGDNGCGKKVRSTLV